ncbi:MAG: alanine racemase [Deltaproteobacteria bacterium]|nr:alanine racemase [Deltaproteobacteria bacterium]
MQTRPTSVIIDTGALKHNFFRLRELISDNTGIMAVVKANAYGHGDVEVASVLEPLGCDFFGVAMAEEGARLRASGIARPIVVLGGVYPGQVEDAIALDLTPVVFDLETVRLIDERAKKSGLIKNVHVKVDTGMGRIGLLPGEVTPFFESLKGFRNIAVEAVLSHFVEAENEDKGFSKKQLGVFFGILDTVRRLGFAPRYIDMANSAAAMDYRDAHFNLIRPGIMLYGAYPAARLAGKVALKPVMSVRTRILSLKRAPAGFPVGYGRTFVTKRESVIATLPIGYADGFPRRLSGNADVLVRGARAPVVGTVCMDMAMCDVTDVPGAEVGDEVVVMGSQDGESITAEEIAGKAGTISYEIFCGVSARVPRIYV